MQFQQQVKCGRKGQDRNPQCPFRLFISLLGPSSQKKMYLKMPFKMILLKGVGLVSVHSSHLPFKMLKVGFRAFRSPLYQHKRAN